MPLNSISLKYETDLDNIYGRKTSRLTKDDSMWYKINSGGSCPHKSSKQSTLLKSYSDEFRCVSYDFRNRATKAELCASERMADMKYTKKKIDIDHIKPIKLAYEFGKDCIQKISPSAIKSYNERFQERYRQLIKDRNDIHNIFKSGLSDIQFPLESKNNTFDKLKRLDNYLDTVHLTPILSNLEINKIKAQKTRINYYINNKHLFTNDFIIKLKNSLELIKNAYSKSSEELVKLFEQIDIESIDIEAQKQMSTLVTHVGNSKNHNNNENNEFNLSSFIKKNTIKFRKNRSRTRKLRK